MCEIFAATNIDVDAGVVLCINTHDNFAAAAAFVALCIISSDNLGFVVAATGVLCINACDIYAAATVIAAFVGAAVFLCIPMCNICAAAAAFAVVAVLLWINITDRTMDAVSVRLCCRFIFVDSDALSSTL